MRRKERKETHKNQDILEEMELENRDGFGANRERMASQMEREESVARQARGNKGGEDVGARQRFE